ncbi:Clathrin, heavy chain/VPS, 7-fold repeat-containing protein [Artemisia annua]|uniref:Clathrin, heavy chain/VPS, 7-fold repeat-containing protein n=1 Tax=Artemisia annua TaxID=35608 RepID=A0A2U1PNG9_ARTAN|nr:Clathrin, heavy chain/VPS, 7-fold repeat-containing protein [Artemisia annua]
MTRYITTPPMELDLDAFLQSQTSDEDEKDENDHSHRTALDELLLTDSSDDSSPSSSPRAVSSPLSNSSNSVDVDRLRSESKFSSVSRMNMNSGGESVGVVRQLPPLFGSVRSSAKPGAALAAAAAASRSVPTPHAAAIKLRRERSSVEGLGLDRKVSVGSEISYESGANSESSHLDKVVDLESVPVESSESFEVSGEVSTGVVNASEVERFEVEFGDEGPSSVVEPDVGSLNNDGTMSVSYDGSDDVNEGNYLESTPISTLQSVEELGTISDEQGDAIEDEEEPISVLSEKDASENLEQNEKDTEFGLQVEGDVETVVQAGVSVDMSETKVERTPERPRLKPLELAEELEKKHAFTGLHWEEGAAAQPMKLEGVHGGSTVLGYFSVSSDNTITKIINAPNFKRDHGTPQVLAVHLNYIAIGMSRGLIVVFPSKYSPHYPDNMDTQMLMLGLLNDKSYAPVTSMSFNQQGDLLFAGYADGHYKVWDVQKVSAAKVVTEHKAPVVHMLYLGMESQDNRHFNVVSGDGKGVVRLIRFSTNSSFPWIRGISASKTSTLFNEQTRTVVCASPLLSEERFGSTNIGTGVAGDLTSAEEGVVIFLTHQSALVAKVIAETPVVYAQLPRPDGVREGSMPYTAWKYIAPSRGSVAENAKTKDSETVPLLAIAWDCIVQVAKLVKAELKISAKWTLDSPAIGVAWLDDQMLVVLTSAGKLCLYANDGSLIHDTSFAIDGGRGDDLIGYHNHFNIFGNPEKAHHNCIAVRGASLYLLGPTHLVVSRLLPWKERIEVLRKGGDWMGAFNMAMMLYDGQAHGVFDLPRALVDVHKTIMPYLVELLLAYVDDVFSYISVALGNQLEKVENLKDSVGDSYSVTSQIKEQYTRVGGVAVEFCVHIKRTDILFDEILVRFMSVQQKETFLELLEPYILKDMLGSLPPEIMQALVEHYSTKGWLQRVEQCVLHMDISSLDFNQVVRLCQEHNLYGALIYLFNKGLDDFRTPLEELLRVFRNNDSESAPSLGYRMLVYLKYCFSGLSFPPGHGAISPARLESLRMELICFLLEESSAPSSWGLTNLSSKEAYRNLYHLLELDTEATLDVLRCAFMDEVPNSDHSLHESAVEKDSASQSRDLVQKTVDVLALIPVTISIRAIELDTSWPSKDDICHILDFISHFVACKELKVSKELLGQIFEYLILEAAYVPPIVESKTTESFKRREKEVLALLEVVPETDWDDRYLLDVCEKAHFYQVCGFIYDSKRQYIDALDSFMKDVDEPVHAFAYINNLLRRQSDKPDSLDAAVTSRIPDLVQLSREGTFFLVVEHFFQEFEQILSELRSNPKSLFLYLKTLIEAHSKGTVNFSALKKEALCFRGRRVKNQTDRVHDLLERISEFPKFLRENPVHVTDEMTELYLELLCQYEPKSVLHFLETCESYRVDHCLRLCQEHGIIDAAAFLLERVGDVGSALSFTLSDLADRFNMLDAAVESIDDYAGVDRLNVVMKTKEVNDILYIVHTCVGLCQRNSSRLDPNESEALWFQFLDTFCEPLKIESELKDQNGISSRFQGGKAINTKWKIRGSDRSAQILRKLFSIFIKEIVEGMIGFVRLPTVMMKLLSDNGNQEFGDFKATILGMLGTYDFEKRILDTAKSLIEDDTYYTMNLLKRGASHGHGPRNLICCICNCLLTKDSSTTGIRVYNCGHASHLHCESPTKETSRRKLSTGCPICMTKKKGVRSKGNSTPAENGLVSKSLQKHKLPLGTGAIHVHENDALDRQLSRYEILINLDKNKRIVQVNNMPQLRLAPPAVYHEKVKKGVAILRGESSSNTSGVAKIEKTKTGNKVKDLKTKGSGVRFPLKSNIFGKEKTSRR